MEPSELLERIAHTLEELDRGSIEIWVRRLALQELWAALTATGRP
jgi:hypothetical protein